MEGAWWKKEDRTLESLSICQRQYEEGGGSNRADLMKFYNSEFQVWYNLVCFEIGLETIIFYIIN